MKGLLNNKWFVFALGGGALTMAAMNIVAPILNSDSALMDEEVMPFGMGVAATLPPVSVPYSNTNNPSAEKEGALFGTSRVNQDLYNIGWGLESPRDPFTQFSTTSPDSMRQTAQTPTSLAPSVSRSSVTAIAVANDLRIAVIDGKLTQLKTVRDVSQAAQIISRPPDNRDNHHSAAKFSLAKDP